MMFLSWLWCKAKELQIICPSCHHQYHPVLCRIQLKSACWFIGAKEPLVMVCYGEIKVLVQPIFCSKPAIPPPSQLRNGHCYWQSFGNNSNTPAKSWEIIREILTMDSHKQEKLVRPRWCWKQHQNKNEQYWSGVGEAWQTIWVRT